MKYDCIIHRLWLCVCSWSWIPPPCSCISQPRESPRRLTPWTFTGTLTLLWHHGHSQVHWHCYDTMDIHRYIDIVMTPWTFTGTLTLLWHHGHSQVLDIVMTPWTFTGRLTLLWHHGHSQVLWYCYDNRIITNYVLLQGILLFSRQVFSIKKKHLNSVSHNKTTLPYTCRCFIGIHARRYVLIKSITYKNIKIQC